MKYLSCVLLLAVAAFAFNLANSFKAGNPASETVALSAIQNVEVDSKALLDACLCGWDHARLGHTAKTYMYNTATAETGAFNLLCFAHDERISAELLPNRVRPQATDAVKERRALPAGESGRSIHFLS